MKIAIGAILILGSSFTQAQLQYDYTPRERHTSQSIELINSLAASFEEEDRIMNGNREVHKINYSRKTFFLSKIHEGAFIKDDSLETYVNKVLQKIVTDNELDPYPRRVLILASPYVNAICFGRGVYAVTISLLGRIENENQLAFILSHELSHDELGHISARIVQEAELDLAEKAQDQVSKIVSGKIIMDDFTEFRKLVYGISKHSRKNEMLSDSMSVALLSGAHYNEDEALSALSVLQSAQSPKQEIGAEMFLPFHSPNYPFQDHWLNDRLTVFSKKYTGNFLYSSDSVESHPTIELRKEALRSLRTSFKKGINHQPIEFVKQVTEIAAFETVETAFKNKEYDLCMYYAMQLHTRYPQNAYLVSRMGKVMLDLYEAKNSNRFDQYVSRYTTNYCDELKLVNGLLYNLSSKELGEVAFHFLSKSSNFNDREKSHYYLLWKISGSTYRTDSKEKVKEAFKQNFASNITSYKYR